MTKRIDNLPANNLQQRITAIQTALQQLKTQQTAGSDSVVLTRTVSGDSPDFTMHPTYHVVNIWQVTFAPNDTTLVNTGLIWKCFFDETEAGPNSLLIVEQVPTNQYVHNLYAMGLTEGESDTIPITIVIYAIGGGTISIEQIA